MDARQDAAGLTTHADEAEDPELDLKDPFRYGYRYVERRLPDGRVVIEDVPLTPEDVLHPKLGDHIMTGDAHSRDVAYLQGCFEAILEHDPTAIVLSDCQIRWQVKGIRPHGPDISVFLDVHDRKPFYDSFPVKREGARPLLIVEVTSPATRKTDFNEKVAQYAQVGVPWYAIADAHRGTKRQPKRTITFHGFRLGPEGVYERFFPDDLGRLWLEALGVWLTSTAEGQVRCILGATGEVMPDRREEREARRIADRARIEADRARIEADRARTEADRARIEADRARIEAELARAEAEIRAAQRDTELEALRAELRRLKGEAAEGP